MVDFAGVPTTAAACLAEDEHLKTMLGPGFVDYWLETRQWEAGLQEERGGHGNEQRDRQGADRYFELT